MADEQFQFSGSAWRAMLSSRHDEWETPRELFDELDSEFAFTLDT